MSVRYSILSIFLLFFASTGFAYSNLADTSSVALISQGGTVTLHASNSGAVAYQWYKNGAQISQAIQKDYVATDVGSYTVISYNSSSCSSPLSDPIQVQLAPALTITVVNNTKPYGTNNPVFTYIYTGFLTGDNISSLTGTPVASTQASIGSAVGSYAVSASGATSAKYSITYVSGSLSITPVQLTVTAKNDVAYQSSQPYTKGNGVNYSGFVNGDGASSLGGTLSYSGSAIGATAVGSYTINVSGLTSNNYNISYQPGTLNIVANAVNPIVTTPVDTTGKPPVTITNPIDTTSKPITIVSNPVDTTSKPIGVVSPVDTTSKPIGVVSPVDTTSKPIGVVSPVDTTLNKAVDIAVDNISESRSVGIGETFDYIFTVTNKSLINATNVQLTDVLPAGLDYASVEITTSGNATYNSANRTLTWLIGDLDANVRSQLTLKVLTNKSGTFNNSVSVSSAQKDSVSSNNTSLDSKTITGIKIPNIFTPNGDGVNDTFVIPSLANFPDNQVDIYNRAGINVYSKKSYQNDWSGTGLSDGTYFYVVTVKTLGGNFETYKGYVTLLRTNVN